MPLFRLTHTVQFRFGLAREGCDVRVSLRPRDLGRQKIVAKTVVIEPLPVSRRQATDQWGNAVIEMTLAPGLHSLVVTGLHTVDLAWSADALDIAPADLGAEPPQDPLPRVINDWAARLLPSGKVQPDDIERFCRGIRRDFAFDRKATRVNRPIMDIFSSCRGVCQDFARLAIAVLRARGVPCLYMTGYLVDESPRPRRIDPHAWFAAWCDGLGWMEFDPLAPGKPRIVLSIAAEQQDAIPVTGECHGPPTTQRLEVDVLLERI